MHRSEAGEEGEEGSSRRNSIGKPEAWMQHDMLGKSKGMDPRLSPGPGEPEVDWPGREQSQTCVLIPHPIGA